MLRDERGNFAMLFGLTGVIMILAIGLGIDYFAGVSAKARLDGAADAAALTAVNAAKAYYEAHASSGSLVANSQLAGQTAGAAAFKANVASTVLSAPITPSFTWASFSNQTFSVTVSYSGNVPTIFGNFVNLAKISLSGSATAQSQMPLYEDFYVLTDVSGSMGLPTTVANQQLLQQTNPDNAAWYSSYPQGCQFACHYPGSQGFAYTQQPNGSGGVLIPLKLNDVGSALTQLLSTAQAAETVANQYRVGIYTYNYTMAASAPLSTNLTSTGQAYNVATNLANYLDNGSQAVWYATYFDTLWGQLSPYLQATGTGAGPSSTLPFIIIVTDGVENHSDQSPRFYLPDTTSSSSLCTKAKAAGITVAVLLIPYSPLTNANPNFAGNEDGWVNYFVDPTDYANPGNGYGQTLLPGQNSVSNMQLCASNGYFFQANSASAINTAMQQIFFQATNATRLTQ